MRQRVADIRAAKQAAALRQFWQTHHGVTWQVGPNVSILMQAQNLYSVCNAQGTDVPFNSCLCW